MPGRHNVTIGSGGEGINRVPASEAHNPTVPWQRNASSNQEAERFDTPRLDGFSRTRPEATKREVSADNETLAPSAANAFRWCVEWKAPQKARRARV